MISLLTLMVMAIYVSPSYLKFSTFFTELQ